MNQSQGNQSQSTLNQSNLNQRALEGQNDRKNVQVSDNDHVKLAKKAPKTPFYPYHMPYPLQYDHYEPQHHKEPSNKPK